jgi:hypothetical protein
VLDDQQKRTVTVLLVDASSTAATDCDPCGAPYEVTDPDGGAHRAARFHVERVEGDLRSVHVIDLRTDRPGLEVSVKPSLPHSRVESDAGDRAL